MDAGGLGSSTEGKAGQDGSGAGSRERRTSWARSPFGYIPDLDLSVKASARYPSCVASGSRDQPSFGVGGSRESTYALARHLT